MYTNTHVKSKPSSDQRCSRDRNCETETWSKLRDRDFIKEFETRDLRCEIDTETRKFVDYANFSKTCHHHFKIEFFFEFLAVFLPALVVSHLQIQQTKGTLNYGNFAMPYRCGIKSLKQ